MPIAVAGLAMRVEAPGTTGVSSSGARHRDIERSALFDLLAGSRVAALAERDRR
ncbi:MAG TPA: hypothetical protein VGL41_13490 [Roseiarcus sp.]